MTTGAAERDVICGAANFAVGDRVPFAQPGAVLPGGFEIGAKKAYGRMSEGMICSAAELAIGHDQSLGFNWSHSGDQALIAVGRHIMPGVDLEYRD